MPVELPGLYWDEERNRYFPLSSKPKGGLKPTTNSGPDTVGFPTTGRHLKRKRKAFLWSTTQNSLTTFSTQTRYKNTHEILSSHYADTSRLAEMHIPTFGRIKVFRTTTINGQTRRFIGDSRGWLYTSSPSNEEHSSPMSLWAADINLQPESEISSICVSGARCVATCFGPSAKISVQDLNVVGRTSLLNLNGVHDIWTSHLQGNALVLGANKKAVFMQDIDVSTSIQTLDTQSDVFAVFQLNDLIYTGSRNGSITRFDKRLGKPRAQKLFDDRFNSQQRASVLHLECLGDSQLLVSHMNGNLVTFDLRFTRSTTPVTRYLGHTNTHTHRLGIALDPSQEFLFAAGEDRKIRGWSVKSGLPLLPTPPPNPAQKAGGRKEDIHNPFLGTFPIAIETMQVAAEIDGLSLWAACDENLYQFHLGQRG